MNERMSADAHRVLWAQALRAFGYGFASVLLGVTLQRRGFSTFEAGGVLSAVVAGTVLASLFVARWADRLGRRRCYLVLYLILALTGAVFAYSRSPWLLAAVALCGALSTEVVESGPFTSLEQAMLAAELPRRRDLVRGFGVYNAVASASGSLGALAAGGPALLRHVWSGGPADDRFFLVLVPVALAGAMVAASLSPRVEAAGARQTRGQLRESKPVVTRLAGLFAVDSFGGGFVVQAFIAYWLARRYGASVATVGVVFFAIGLLQTGSFLVAARLGARFGLLRTMVGSHLPSNVLLMCVPLAPNLTIAIVLLLARTALSQMDVPTRQAYVMALVPADERTAAAAYTNTARYLVRPIGPLLAGTTQSLGLGVPFVIAGTVKGAYDLALWRWFSKVALREEAEPLVLPEVRPK